MDDYIRHGTPAFHRTNLALFASGVATFGLLYCVQPLLPEFSSQFQISAASSALSLSLPSGVLATTLLVAGPASDTLGRKRVMTWSLLSSACVSLLSAAAPTWQTFLLLRALLGFTLGGIPAVAMAYLGEEMHSESIGLGMGIYVGGNAAGGMGGRLISGVLTDYFGWRAGVGCVSAIGAVAACAFVYYLPPSRRFVRLAFRTRSSFKRSCDLFRDPGLPWLFVEGFLLLGAFTTVYNYASFRLMAPPYALRQSAVGMIFCVYVVGMVSSSWVGHVAGQRGRRKVLWTMFVVELAGLGLTMAGSIALIVAGIAVITFGFFGGHSVASSWVGRRAGGAKAQAAAMYLCAYYLGGAVTGALGGVFYSAHGWNGTAAFVATLFALGLLCAWRLYHLVPLPTPRAPRIEPPIP